jgi:rhamnogalacturonan endolyase
VLLVAPEGNALRLFTTTIPTTHRLTTLLHDSQYRLGLAWQNVSYNKPAHPSFYLGEGMKEQ